MYKKVTHNIVEEHFDHPMAQEIKKMVDHGAKMGAAWPPEPKSWQLGNELKSQFTEFNTALRNVITGSGTTDPALTFNKQRLTELTAAFGPFFEPYYGKPAAEAVVGHIAEFAKAIENTISAAAAKGDWNTPAAAALTHLNALASLITSWNPGYWNNRSPALATYLSQYYQAVVNQISSRAGQDWTKDAAQAERARQIIANGPLPFSPFNNAPDLASQIAFMITQQFPEKFAA
jgi:hypothetical protein